MAYTIATRVQRNVRSPIYLPDQHYLEKRAAAFHANRSFYF